MGEVLVAEDLRRTYGETTALDGVSLTVDEGEIVAVVGPNGAGKTTLVRALTGTTDAEGSVRVFGDPPRAVDRARIGLLPQAFDPPERLTARELLTYYAGLYDESRPVGAVLDDVGLAGAADTWYEDLSGGQQRRACVGATLVNDPDLLFLDEPSTGIDPAGRRDLWGVLEDLVAGGASVVLTTHDMAEAERLADRVGLLADGRLVAMDSPAALVDEHGGDSRLVVETAGVPDPSVTDALAHPVEIEGRRLTVRGVAPEEIGDVTATLAAAGLDYESLTWSDPDLEDVYLSLAGRPAAETGADGRPGRDEPPAATAGADGRAGDRQ